MKYPTYCGDKVYTSVELLVMNDKILKAHELTKEAIENLNIRDEGTCVLGSGIGVWYVPPRCTLPRRKIIVDGPFQGNVSNYMSLQFALEYLRKNGVECHYYDGVMD